MTVREVEFWKEDIISLQFLLFVFPYIMCFIWNTYIM